MRAAVGNHLEKSAAGVVVFLMSFEMLGELVDARRENRDLHWSRSGVGSVYLVLFDDCRLLFCL